MNLVKHLPDKHTDPELPHRIWASLLEDGGEYFVVSTVKLSIDHGFDGMPLWFETMTFRSDKDGNVIDWCDLSCDRYTTEVEALRGHENVVRTFRKEGL